MKLCLYVLVFLAGASLPCAAIAGSSRADRAAQLHASALARLARGGHEERARALAELEEAVLLDPARADVALALGRLDLEFDQRTRARAVANHMIARDSSNAAAWLLAGEVWRREWLTTVDDDDRDHAIVCLARSGRLAPAEPAAWLELGPLLMDAGEAEAAYGVARRAVRAAPHDPHALALLATAAQGVGELAVAEPLFLTAIAKLPAPERERYDDLSPLLAGAALAAYNGLAEPARSRFVDRFWADTDPDPVTGENEARAEYWARVTQALLLFGTSRPGEWDMRAQYYVRFGKPAFAELNPIRKPEWLHRGDWLAWTYPDLGLRVWMGTPSASLGFSEGISTLATFAHASPDSLARRREFVPIAGGWAVLHRLPPGLTLLDTRIALARFQAGQGTNVFAEAECPGGFADRLDAEWVVLDTANAEVARGRAPMSPSSCQPEAGRSAGFTTPLPAGRYSVAVEVSDTLGHRGTLRRPLTMPPPATGLAISDVVVVCGAPEQSAVASPSVRLEPRTGLFPADGDRVNAYFEIYNLATAPGGEARYEYDCEVRARQQDRRGWLSRMISPLAEPAPVEVRRSDTTVGSLRRQFVGVPVGSLPPGSYQISVVVRDLTTNATATGVASFERGSNVPE